MRKRIRARMVRRGLAEAVLVAVLLGTAGCAPTRPVGLAGSAGAARVAPDDRALANAVLDRLLAADRAGFQSVSVLAWRGSVLLTGAVVRPGQRQRAERTAAGVDGVHRVLVDLHLIEAPLLPEFLPESAGEQTLLARLDGQPGRYAVRLVHGVAYLLGTAPTRAVADRAADTLREADGVKWVVDHTQAEDGR
ncbi:MAG: hypothetical protein RLZZ501_1049 [Pseudomonadota bacterium]